MIDRSIIVLHFILISLILFTVGFKFSDNMYPYYERGNELVKHGDYNLAIYYYSKAIERDQRFAPAYCNRGIAFMRRNAFDLALVDFNKAIELDNAYTDAYFNRGGLRGKTGDLDGAIADFNTVVGINPHDLEAFDGRALAFERKGDHASALADYNKALELNPSYSDGYFGRALLWRRIGRYDRAIADYNTAIATDENNFKAYGNKAHLLATCPDSRYRDGKLALQLAQKALDLDRSAISVAILAAAYAENEKYEEAVKLQKEAISLLETEGNERKLPEFRQQLESYQYKKPWRE